MREQELARAGLPVRAGEPLVRMSLHVGQAWRADMQRRADRETQGNLSRLVRQLCAEALAHRDRNPFI